jgi:16S rRNA (adenine1518-N6/adenine1519-N6)-dimethyltransferase
MTHQSRTTILALLERHGLLPRKAYGQHFLADPNLIDKIVAVAGVGPDDSVLEVGAGTGVLTAALAVTGASVVAYEIDRRFQPVLAETLVGLDVDVRFGDIMDVDLDSDLDGEPWKLVANLPYNVGTPLVMDVLLEVHKIRSATVMVQKEVADRLVAEPGTEDYGVPSVVVALTAQVVERFSVPPQVFVPAPQVSSSVVRLDRVEPPALIDGAIELARAAFGQRRKMLRRSLAERVPEPAFEEAGIESTGRPEDLPPEAFVRLAEVMSHA